MKNLVKLALAMLVLVALASFGLIATAAAPEGENGDLNQDLNQSLNDDRDRGESGTASTDDNDRDARGMGRDLTEDRANGDARNVDRRGRQAARGSTATLGESQWGSWRKSGGGGGSDEDDDDEDDEDAESPANPGS